jgi:hypothetical protein
MNYITTDIQKTILRSLQDVKSAAEVSMFLDEIKAATYNKDPDLRALVDKMLAYCYPLAELMRGRPPEDIRGICVEGQETLEKADRIKAEMSYVPSRDFISGLYEIFESMGYSFFLLDFAVDSEIGTGARFYHKGNFIDVSMVNVIKDKMKNIGLSSGNI